MAVENALIQLSERASIEVWSAVTSRQRVGELIDVLRNNVATAIVNNQQIDDVFINHDDYVIPN